MRKVRGLTSAEIAAFGLSTDLGQRVRLIRVGWLGPGVRAVTLGRWVFLCHRELVGDYSELLAHELVHVLQYERLGLSRFWWGYVSEYMRLLFKTRRHEVAYGAISYERQARVVSENWLTHRSHLTIG